jgi:hypothetical protein
LIQNSLIELEPTKLSVDEGGVDVWHARVCRAEGGQGYVTRYRTRLAMDENNKKA